MKRAAIIGWPVSHSRSPLIHGHWLREHGIDGSYDRCAVAPEQAEDFFTSFAASGLVGGNVTIPHKEVAARLATRREPLVERLGAANTLWLEAGELWAGNTDQYGFLANLDDRAPGWDAGKGTALIVGAGGATVAVANGLLERGLTVRICNRTLARAEALVARLGGAISAHALDEAGRLAADAQLIVNATSLGMKGEGDLDIDFRACHRDALVTDIVYVPLETPFLGRARAEGLATVDGLGMLLHQAVPAFEKWFGVRPAVTPALRQLIEADL